MNQPLNEFNPTAVIEAARAEASNANLPYAGSITPTNAWALFNAGDALLIDVRSNEERHFVGLVPGSLNVSWATGTSLTRNPRFVREVEAKVDKNALILLLCRSGKRSALAAEALTKAGFEHVFNILEGFEGEINEYKQRGLKDGWKFHKLPWEQD